MLLSGVAGAAAGSALLPGLHAYARACGRALALGGIGCVSLLIAGCIDLGGVGIGPAGRVAVLDLDKLADEVGIKVEIQKTLKDVETTLNAELAKSRDAATEALRARRDQYGSVPTAAEQREVRVFAEQTRQQLLEQKNQANATLAARRQQLVEQLKALVSPIAAAVAARRGMEVVLLRTSNVLTVTPKSDITAEVVIAVRDRVPVLKLDAGS